MSNASRPASALVSRLEEVLRRSELSYTELFEEDAERFYRETGLMAPGKSVPLEMWTDADYLRRRSAWEQWSTRQRDEPLELIREAAAALSRGGSSTGETLAVERAQRAGLMVSRFEVIDHRFPEGEIGKETGRVFVANPAEIELSYQDDGKTLKVFLSGPRPQKAALSAPSSPPLKVGNLRREGREDVLACLSSDLASEIRAKLDEVLPLLSDEECNRLSPPSSQAPLPADYETNPRACRQCGLSLAACFRWRGGQTHQPCCDACDHDAMPSSQATPLIEGDR